MGYNKERYKGLKKMGYYILYVVWYALSLLPFWILYLLSDILYYLTYCIGGYRKKVVRKNLASSFPEKSEIELIRIERSFYHFLCDYLVESIKLMTINKKDLRKRMVFKGTELLEQCVEEGQSCATYLGHYCNWEWVTSLPLWIKSKTQCGQIYHPLENQIADCLFLSLRQRHNALCISMQDTLRKILEFQHANHPIIIGYIADQKPYWTNIHHWVNFLHHDTPVLTGTERIIRKVNHAVFYLDIHCLQRGYYEAEFKLITREPQKMKEYELTNAYYRLLEESIRRAPAYWLWSHDRWSRTREEFNRLYEIIDGKVMKK